MDYSIKFLGLSYLINQTIRFYFNLQAHENINETPRTKHGNLGPTLQWALYLSECLTRIFFVCYDSLWESVERVVPFSRKK